VFLKINRRKTSLNSDFFCFDFEIRQLIWRQVNFAREIQSDVKLLLSNRWHCERWISKFAIKINRAKSSTTTLLNAIGTVLVIVGKWTGNLPFWSVFLMEKW
jgi:hypothetical protein